MIEEFQRKTIYDSVRREGWSITEIEKFETDWWASEMWQLESTWSPVGKIAFITFMSDPQDITVKVAWEARASLHRPESRTRWDFDFCRMSMKNRWQGELPKFIECLAKLRNQ